MKIPKSNRKKALIIVDVQPAFINKRNKYIIKNIQNLMNSVKYDFYVESVFHAEKNSLWDKQEGWILPKTKKSHTVPEITRLLPDETIHVLKGTKSAFKGNKKLAKALHKNKIREVHIVGLDTNDCVLATAYDSFDYGFFTYIIEECVQSSASNKLHKNAISLLRHLNLTNNSVYNFKQEK